MFDGVFTAIVTPFQNNAIDERAFCDLIEWQISQGVHGIVVCGTTGEAPTLTTLEKQHLFHLAIKQAAGRCPIIGGSGTNATATTIEQTLLVKEMGCAAALIVTPYYNKPTQEGLYQHFSAVAKAADIPIILYNVPGRTGVDMQPETVIRLSKIPSIIGIKECAGLERVKSHRANLDKTFVILSGEDPINAQSYLAGANGSISVASNVVPAKVTEVYTLASSHRGKEAIAAQEKLQPLIAALFIESNPIPAKTALAAMCKVMEEFRLPLTPMAPQTKQTLLDALRHYQ